MLYPPRIKTAIPPNQHNLVEGWLTQLKYNDTRIIITPDNTIWNRHGAKLNYSTPPELQEQLHHLKNQLPPNTVLDGGLLHYKHPTHNNTIIIWDILQIDGKLNPDTYNQRHTNLLNTTTLKLTDFNQPKPYTLYILNNIHYTSELWETIKTHPTNTNPNNPNIEGIVFKKPQSKLKPMHSKENNNTWAVKSRLPTKKYPF